MADTSTWYYQTIAAQDAIKYRVDPRIFVAQITQESGWNPRAVSPQGAVGIAQIMPGTAAAWHVDPNDPIASLDAAAKAMGSYLQKYGGNYRDALAAYNAGAANVDKYGGVPPFAETENYVNVILRNASGGSTSTPSASPTPTPNDPLHWDLMKWILTGDGTTQIGQASQPTPDIVARAQDAVQQAALQASIGAVFLAFIAGGIAILANSKS